MDNPNTLAILGIQDAGRRPTKQKITTQNTERICNTDPTKPTRMNPVVRKG
jgi:hypothetical protein